MSCRTPDLVAIGENWVPELVALKDYEWGSLEVLGLLTHFQSKLSIPHPIPPAWP